MIRLRRRSAGLPARAIGGDERVDDGLDLSAEAFDPLSAYLLRIGRVALLSAAQEVALGETHRGPTT